MPSPVSVATKIAIGQDLQLTVVDVNGQAPQQVELRWRSQGELVEQRLSGEATADPARVRFRLERLARPLEVRASGGEIVAVTEDEIVRALGALARQGFYVEPTSAAAAAGLSQLIARGVIKPGDAVITLGAGSIGTLPGRLIDALAAGKGPR